MTCMPSFTCIAINLSYRVLGEVLSLEGFPDASSGVHYE
jgi:hypothetical protein